MFLFNKTIIREPTVCEQLNNKVQYLNWRQYCNFSEAQAVGSLMTVWLNRNM